MYLSSQLWKAIIFEAEYYSLYGPTIYDHESPVLREVHFENLAVHGVREILKARYGVN